MRNNGFWSKIAGITLSFFILSMTLLWPVTNYAFAASSTPYLDVDKNFWAYKYVLKMNMRGVVSGYLDKTFKPDNAVSQLEAVLMAVKNMEADSELAKIDTSRKLPFTVPAWAEQKAKRELLFAVDKGLIVPSEKRFDCSSLATRAWMTQLMVRMIGKDSEALSNVNNSSSFTDDASIPSWAKNYVNTAVKYDLISGFPDNSFKPNQIVTRAQTVVLLSRSESNLALNSVIRGKIINISGSTLTISAAQGIATVTVNNDTIVFDKSGETQVSNLSNGDNVSIVLQNTTAKFMEVTESSSVTAGTTITGTVIRIIPEERVLVISNNNNELQTYTVGNTVTCVNSQNQLCDFTQIAEGANVQVSLDNLNNITTIVISGQGTHLSNTGIIKEIDEEKELLILKSPSGTFDSYFISDLVEVFIPGQRFATIKDLQVGDEIKIKADASYITEIELLQAKQEMSFSAKAVVILPDKNVLVIKNDAGNLETYAVSSDVNIQISGMSSPLLGDILENDSIDVVVKAGVITSITVTNRDVSSTIKGTVVAVDVSSGTIVLRNEDDELVTYETSKYVEYNIDGNKNASLSAVEKDMKVEIELLAGKIIFLQNQSTLGGTVVSVNEDRNLISIKSASGKTSTYQVSKSVDVCIEDDTRADLADIDRNDYVELKLSHDQVTVINVERTFTCEVLRVDQDDLKIEDENGDSKYIDYNKKIDILIPGISNPDFEDFDEGDTIKVTYMGFEVTKIELAAATAGQITYINAGSQTITIRTFDGKTENIKLTADSKYVENGNTYYSLTTLSVNDRVKIKETSSGDTIVYVMNKIRTRYVDTEDNNKTLYVTRSSKYTYAKYSIASPCYIHKGTSTLSFRDLAEEDWVDIWVIDEVVYEIEKI